MKDEAEEQKEKNGWLKLSLSFYLTGRNFIIIFVPCIAPAIVELSEEQKEKILSSPEFQHFLDRTSRIIERAIYEKDVTFDYGKTEDIEG